MSSLVFRRLFTRYSLTPATVPSIPRATALNISNISPALSPTSTVTANAPPTASPCAPWRQSRSFHITAAAQAKSKVPARGGKKGKKRKGRLSEGPDPRIINLKSSMSRKVPSPLRFARNRALRHWTIHRAWLLYQRKERVRQEVDLERIHRSMHNACEELRKTSGPGTREEGYLYRVAMEKHGMYGHNAVPIEYARPQTETPARQAWNHEWTR